MADDKRCETCRWWKSTGTLVRDTRKKTQAVLGNCEHPIPIPDSMKLGRPMVWQMTNTQGTTCPCWQPKEDGDAE